MARIIDIVKEDKKIFSVRHGRKIQITKGEAVSQLKKEKKELNDASPVGRSMEIDKLLAKLKGE